MLNTVLKSAKGLAVLGTAMVMTSCGGREGCPANQFSIDTDIFDALAQLLQFIF